MKKFIPLYTYGAITIFAGLFLLFSPYNSFDTVKYTVGISLSVGAVFAFITAIARKRDKVQFTYHEIHALAMLTYGVAVILFATSMESLLYITAFLFVFYTFSEIIFCIWIFNLRQKINYKIVFVRLFLGFVTAIGTVIILNYSTTMKISSMKGFGVLFAIIGANILLFVPIMKSREENVEPEEAKNTLQSKYHFHTSVKY